MARTRKPARYPKKFRQKLEKMRDAREARATEDQAQVAVREALDVLHYSWIPKGSCDVVLGRVDDERMRLTTVLTLRKPWRPDYVFNTPPFAPSAPDDAQ